MSGGAAAAGRGGIVSAGTEGLDHLASVAEMEWENLERERNKSDDIKNKVVLTDSVINKNKNNNNLTDSATKKPLVLESKRCPPSKNASASLDSDPFVFYLGFGLPRRGKRRGERSDTSGSNGSKNLGQEHDQLNPLYLDRMITEDFEYNEDEETREKGKKKAKKSIKARSLKSVK